MRVKKPSIQLIATLAIFIAVLFVPSTRATAGERVLHSFANDRVDGNNPYSSLIFDAAGNLYGTTVGGGPSGDGTVFELTPGAGGTWTEKVLHSFSGGADGTHPYAGLIFDAAGNLYGTTDLGGAYGYGTVFELTPAAGGTWTEKVLHNFNNEGTDGIERLGPLIIDAAGNLYGTTYQGGAYNSYGTVFELTPAAGGTWTEKVLHSFGNGTDGLIPYGGLIFDAAGNLYGTTGYGGTNDLGTVFELTPAAGGTWTEQVLHSFGSGTDGAYPYAGLIFDGAGNLYGTTSGGGTAHGTLFELTPAGGGTWTEQVLHNFGNGTDGAEPLASLIFDGAGNLYGTTSYGGSYGGGTVFRFNAQGEVLLYSFSGTDGERPVAELILDGGGNLYGTTSGGGSEGEGTVFEITNTAPTPYQFVTVAPCRLVDTRPDPGGRGRIHGAK